MRKKAKGLISILFISLICCFAAGCSSREELKTEQNVENNESLSLRDDISSGSDEDYVSSEVIDTKQDATEEDENLIPNFTEDEILNMSDNELCHLGALDLKNCLENVSICPKTEDLIFEEGYKYISFAADTPAQNEEEATQIAKEEFGKFPEIYHGRCDLLGETEEYWFFIRCLDPMPGDKQPFIVVYKQDYYETKESWPEFELTEDFIKNYMVNVKQTISYNICIGEFIIPDTDGMLFRRYTVNPILSDYGLYETELICREWHFYSDGSVEFTAENVRKAKN
ncbi:MAG: hypothetical protein IKH46_11630 [Lachnospiraceae bacterium]|nr:hypothetical protein [Lachnospiraceae bacterium]MBR3104458.1 hypothetical protein [Lachnospiraceae bacterium]